MDGTIPSTNALELFRSRATVVPMRSLALSASSFFAVSLLLPSLAEARTIELEFPGLRERIEVFLPENHDPSKKHPTLFWYHGAGGKPDTSMMRHHTRDRDWIIVGMTYYQKGSYQLSPQSLNKTRTLFQSVQQHLKGKYGLDPARCYVGGFSKGGWVSDLLIQSEPGLAGAAIFGAGHIDQIKSKPSRHRRNKPLLVGIGRKDGNYPFALQAILFHRKLGAHTTLETWLDLAHAFPENGSHALHQWLALQAQTAQSQASLLKTAKQEMQQALKASSELAPLPRWNRLRHLRNLPYSELLGEAWISKLDQQISELASTEPVKSEARALVAHRKATQLEIKANTLDNMINAQTAYQKVASQYQHTRQGQLANFDQNRCGVRIQHFIKLQKTQGSEDSPSAPSDDRRKNAMPEVKPPTNKRRVPNNPLIR